MQVHRLRWVGTSLIALLLGGCGGHEASRGVGAYANYWFDWFWKDPAGVDAPALLIEPATGKVPEMTPKAKESVKFHRDHLHDSYATMETGDRCLSRGTYGIMMPTAYNNGKMFFQTPGHVVILSEMIHNARIIPINAAPHINSGITQWNGDPRGRWEKNTLIVESKNFKAVANQRGPGSRAPHVWLDDDALFDRLGVEFTLLRLEDSAPQARPIEVAAARYGVPLAVLDLNDNNLRDIYGTRLALIRADQHVVWRGNRLPDDCDGLITTIRGA